MKILLFSLLIFTSFNLSAQTFIRNIGTPQINDGATSITKSDKGFIIAGYTNKDAYLTEIDGQGNELWKESYHITDQQDLITDIKYVNGKVIACGYGYYEGTGNFMEFFFQFNIEKKNFDWIKKSKLILKPSTIQVLPNGNYLMTGDEIFEDEFKVFLMEINPYNGKMKKYSSWVFTGNESASTAVIHDNNIYVGGRYALEKKIDKYRGAISKFDFNFNEVWSNYYLNKKEKYLRNYLNKLIIDNNEIISLFNTNNHGISNFYNITLAKQNLDGEMLWAKEITLTGFVNVNIRDIKATKDGYYIYGFTISPSEEFFIIKTDKKGNVLFAKSYGENESEKIETDQGNFMEITNKNIYLIGQSKGLSSKNNYNSILLKINLDGTSDIGCWEKDLKYTNKEFLELIQGGIYLTGNDSLFNTNNLAYKQQDIKASKNPYFCFPKLALNDYDTLYNQSEISIDFLKNDNLSTDANTSYSIVSKAHNGTVVIENSKITYAQKDNKVCAKDSFKYILKTNKGIDTATVFVYNLKQIIDASKELIMPENNRLELSVKSSNFSFSNGTFLWNTGETTPVITVNKSGKYSVTISNKNCLFQKEFEVKENPFSFEKIASTNFSFMLDASISMNRANRMPVLKNALYKILNFMRDEDKLSIVNYSNNSEVIFDGVKATELEKIKSKINELDSKGRSQITEGFKTSLKTINNNYIKGGNNRIIFTTDGDIPNEERDALIKYLKKDFPSNVSFTIFLFNDATIFKEQMKKVADSVNGKIYVITPENVEEILLKEFRAVKK